MRARRAKPTDSHDGPGSNRSPITRRDFLRGAGLFGLGLGPILLAGCDLVKSELGEFMTLLKGKNMALANNISAARRPAPRLDGSVPAALGTATFGLG